MSLFKVVSEIAWCRHIPTRLLASRLNDLLTLAVNDTILLKHKAFAGLVVNFDSQTLSGATTFT